MVYLILTGGHIPSWEVSTVTLDYRLEESWTEISHTTTGVPQGQKLIARFMGPTWGPSGAGRTQMGPMLAPWTLLSGICSAGHFWYIASMIIQQTDKRHHIVCHLGQGMRCVLRPQNTNITLALSLLYCAQYHVVFDRNMLRVYSISL